MLIISELYLIYFALKNKKNTKLSLKSININFYFVFKAVLYIIFLQMDFTKLLRIFSTQH